MTAKKKKSWLLGYNVFAETNLRTLSRDDSVSILKNKHFKIQIMIQLKWSYSALQFNLKSEENTFSCWTLLVRSVWGRAIQKRKIWRKSVVFPNGPCCGLQYVTDISKSYLHILLYWNISKKMCQPCFYMRMKLHWKDAMIVRTGINEFRF